MGASFIGIEISAPPIPEGAISSKSGTSVPELDDGDASPVDGGGPRIFGAGDRANAPDATSIDPRLSSQHSRLTCCAWVQGASTTFLSAHVSATRPHSHLVDITD